MGFNSAFKALRATLIQPPSTRSAAEKQAKVKAKGKVNPRTGHEGLERE